MSYAGGSSARWPRRTRSAHAGWQRYHEPLSNVSYHVRVLADDCGAIELVDTRPVRGSMQHFYSSRVEEPWALAVLGIGESGEQEDSDGQAPGRAAA